MKKKLLSSVFYIVLIAAAATLLVRHFYIKDFHVIIPDELYTSSQPRGMDYARLLYRYHIATIVNVRSATEHLEENWRNEELVWTRQNAVRYIEIPMSKEYCFPNERIQDRFISVMKDKNNLPVLLHGICDDKRAAMLVAVWLRAGQKESVGDTIGQVKKIIDDRPLSRAEIGFINNLKEQ